MDRFRIVPERSRVWIEARSSLHPIHSSADGLEGYIDLETGDGGQVDLDVQPAGKLSLPVTRLSSGNRLEERELRRRIDARRFPTIEGTLTHVDRVDHVGVHGNYRVVGDIVFRGVSRECADEMTVSFVDERTIQVTGQSRFDIRDFGMEPPRILMLRVEPVVSVRVEIIAEREG